MAYIAEHAWPARSYDSTRLRLDEVAQAVGVSRRQLQRLLREVGDITFGEALQAASMRRAEHVLLSGNDPIRDIARRAGYRHSGHFAKVFRRHQKAAPARMRRKRLGPRRARRVGGLRGTALHEGRLSPTEIRAREQEARRALRWCREEAERARDEPTTHEFLGSSWAEIVLGFHISNLRRLRREVEVLDRGAWRERDAQGKARRAALAAEIDAAVAQLEQWHVGARERRDREWQRFRGER
jgi:AraC-like DNA-binding protein